MTRRAVDVRRDLVAIVVVFRGGENQPHVDALRHLDRLQDALAVGEAAEEEQVVVGLRLERERVGVDAMQHRVDDGQALEQARLFVGDRDEGRLGIARPQADLRFARRMMQRLDHRRRRQAREGERHRVVRRLVVDDVEVARPLDRGGEVQHLVQLPRPHVLVVPVALLVDRVQLRLRLRIGGGEERDVLAFRDQAFGEQRRHQLDRSRLERRHLGGDGGDVRDAQGTLGAHLDATSRRVDSTRSAAKCSRAISPARRACRS